MAEAVIVSTARTGIGKAYRGALNNTHGAGNRSVIRVMCARRSANP